MHTHNTPPHKQTHRNTRVNTDEATEIHPGCTQTQVRQFQNAHIQYFMYLDMHKETHAGTCRRVCTNIHIETHTCAHRHHSSYMHTGKPAAHTRADTDAGSHTDSAPTETPAQICTHQWASTHTQAATLTHLHAFSPRKPCMPASRVSRGAGLSALTPDGIATR